MAGKTDKITLGDQEFTIHAFNIGELERITDLFEGPPRKVPFGVLRVAMERAEPKADPNVIEATTDQVAEAMLKILTLAGLKNPPVPVGPGTEAPAPTPEA